MRRFLFVLALVGLLTLTACDLKDIFGAGEDGKSQAQEAVETVYPYIPNGVPRMLADLVLLGLSITSGVIARKGSAKELAKNEAREYTVEEAASMLRAIDSLKQVAEKAPTQ